MYNIGANHEITIIDLAKKIIQLTNSESEITYLDYDEVYGKNFEDMQRRLPDITKISELTGFRPKKGIDKIISDVKEYILSR